MVINHETGHWLGLGHSFCSGPGQLAPVMQQQSIDVTGLPVQLVAAPWERHTVATARNLRVLTGVPIGDVTARARPGEVVVDGWSLDPDTTRAATVDVFVDGRRHAVTANRTRRDVGRLYPTFGARHGFRLVVAKAVGDPASACADSTSPVTTPHARTAAGR